MDELQAGPEKPRPWESLCTHRNSHHGVGLPGAGLPIGKHAGIVPLERRLQHVQTQIFEYLQKNPVVFCPDLFTVVRSNCVT